MQTEIDQHKIDLVQVRELVFTIKSRFVCACFHHDNGGVDVIPDIKKSLILMGMI
jgi:hypothetical protein